jgi:hypothetical protein
VRESKTSTLPCFEVFERGILIWEKVLCTYIQGVSEISALILTGNRTHQKEQLFSLPFWRKTMFNSKKKLEKFFIRFWIRKLREFLFFEKITWNEELKEKRKK